VDMGYIRLTHIDGNITISICSTKKGENGNFLGNFGIFRHVGVFLVALEENRKVGGGEMAKKEEKKEKGKVIYDLVGKYGQYNDVDGFVESLRKALSIETVDLQRIKQSYFDYILETGNPVIKFPALVNASRKPVRWSSKGLTISKDLVDDSLYQQAVKEGITYRVTMDSDFRVVCNPIKKD